ncbi:uncharacterized protein TNCV_1347691 [Trichonephila clavipes]|nr:uncharacterized protein TNCV_1347691 [Trichonephila clavipes]
MFDSSSYDNPTHLAHADASRDVLPRGGTSQWRPTRFNLYDPEMRNARGFNVWPEVCFSGSKNVTEFLEGIDNQIKLLEITSDLSCAYLKSHLMGRALDGYQIFGSTLVQNTATNFAQLKAALSKAFPTIQNKKELETWFYASQQRQNEEPSDFVYGLLKLHKKLELGMSEKTLVDHIFVRLEPQVLQTAIQLLEALAMFEKRYSCKATLGSRNSNNVEGRSWNERKMSNVGNNRGNWRHSEVVHRPNNGRNDYRGSHQNKRQGNQWFESRNRFQNEDHRFNDRGYQFRNRGQNDDFSRGDQRNGGSSENFSRGSRKQTGRLNILKVNDIKGDQTQSINQSPIKLSAICMSPIELPYVPILLDETFTKTLWDTGAEKSFIYRKRYTKNIFFKQVKKSSTQVITAQRTKCRNMGVVELNIRIRDFKKLWLLHVLADLEYPCVLGIDFIGGSKIILDFDRKSLAIQESQVEDIEVDAENLRVDLSETKLNVVANVSDNNTIENIIREKVNCTIIRDLVLSSRDQLIEEQKTDPELGHIYRYLENPKDSSVNAAICENWSRDFWLVEGLLFYAKYATSLGEMRVYIPQNL